MRFFLYFFPNIWQHTLFIKFSHKCLYEKSSNIQKKLARKKKKKPVSILSNLNQPIFPWNKKRIVLGEEKRNYDIQFFILSDTKPILPSILVLGFPLYSLSLLHTIISVSFDIGDIYRVSRKYYWHRISMRSLSLKKQNFLEK